VTGNSRIAEEADRVRGIVLEAVLEAVGVERDGRDRSRWRSARGMISVTGAKFMNWNQSFGGGGAIDLAMHLKETDFKSAVAWLGEHFPRTEIVSRQGAVPSREILQLPRPDSGKLKRVRRYLTEERGLAACLIEPVIESGRLYADARGNAVFLLLGNEKMPAGSPAHRRVGAELRGTTHRPWRGMAPGSRKDAGYFSARCAADIGEKNPEGAPGDALIILCESAIDALSCQTLHPESHCLSTSGVRPNPQWLTPLIRRGHQVYCGFDADDAGEKTAQAMISLHPSVRRLRPERHDWNDVLKSRRPQRNVTRHPPLR